jgi:hypothetical protein
MIRFSAGVVVNHWNERLHAVLEYASAWSNLTSIVVDINSIDDKAHGPTTLHHWSLALDLDTDGDRAADLASLHAFLCRYLPHDYDVVLERDHIHVEFDLKRRTAPATPPTRAPRPTPA